MKIMVFYGSIREKGNSEILADYVIKDLKVKKIFLKDYHIPPISDLYHLGGEKFSDCKRDDYRSLIQEQMLADVILFVTPVYWYGLSSLLKTYIDRWSETLRDPSMPDFKEKMKSKEVYLITVGGDHPSLKALPMIQQMQYITEFFQMKFGGYIIGEGNAKGEILTDRNAIHSAIDLNQYLKVKSVPRPSSL